MTSGGGEAGGEGAWPPSAQNDSPAVTVGRRVGPFLPLLRGALQGPHRPDPEPRRPRPAPAPARAPTRHTGPRHAVLPGHSQA